MYDFLVALIVGTFCSAVIITALLWINEFSRYKKGDKEMNENLIPKIAEMLGVTPNEKFKTNIYGDRIFEFSDDSLWERIVECDNDNQYVTWEENLTCLRELLNGGVKVIKLPWKPKFNEKYYTFTYRYRLDDRLAIIARQWRNEVEDNALLKVGWLYKTREEAEQNLPKVAKEYNVPYSLT